MKKLKSFKVAGKKEMSGAYLRVTTPRTSGGIGLVTLELIDMPPVSNCLKQQHGTKTNLELNKK
jgi:hypothetical protein